MQKGSEKQKETNEEIRRNGTRWLFYVFCHGDCSAEYLELKAPGVVRGSGHNNDPGDSNTCPVFRQLSSSLSSFFLILIQCCQTDFWWKEISRAQLQRLMDEAGNRVFTTFECNTQKDPKTNDWS
jgi:hypothetical protein